MTTLMPKKMNQGLGTVAGALVMLVFGTISAMAHHAGVNLVVTPSPNPVAAGTPATIKAKLTYNGLAANGGQANGHVLSANGTPVVGEKVQIQEFMLNGVGVPCGTAGGAGVRIDTGSGGGLDTDANGEVSMQFDTTGLAGMTIGFIAHHPAGGGSHGTEQRTSACVNLEIINSLADMPVNKLINGEPAECTDNPITPVDETDTNRGIRPCYYTGLTLLAGDPRFEINVYTTVNGLPGNSLIGNLPFPQPGVPIPPQFDALVQPGSSFTMCEAPDTTTLPTPYTLTSVTTVVTGGPANGTITNVPIYFYQGHACFNLTVPEGAEEFAVDLNNSIVCSYTQGAYGNTGSGGWGILSTNFATGENVYNPSAGTLGVQIGRTPGANPSDPVLSSGSGHGSPWGARFTSAQAVADFLPPRGGPGAVDGALTQDYLDPTDRANPRPHDVAAQVLTLQINVDLGDAGVFLPGGGGIGNFLIFTGAGNCGDGKTVRDFLADANAFLAGGALPAGCNLIPSDPNNLVELLSNLNKSFDNCVAGPTSTLFQVPIPE